ncbi:hypothetical protein TNCV_209541 [Trichonephila clavipes]|uniref:Uncharacterized protein n=1 Tax=Trichonephila clavipes TaxID=2585209 RepID=A0A8X6T337_TRICX|nr:hypothetical protein TNCV_209541 [Trichonephila clavipes]
MNCGYRSKVFGRMLSGRVVQKIVRIHLQITELVSGGPREHMRETSPAVLMAEATIPVTTLSKKENGMDDLRVVYVKVKGEQEMANAVMDTGAQMPVVRPDVVEGQSIDNRGSVQVTSAFGEHEMGEVKDSNMELNDLRHGVVPVSKNLVNDMLICSSDFEGLIENSQMIRNPAKLREPSKEEGIISSTDSKSVCSQEVITNLRPETYTQSLLNVPNGDLVAVKINTSNVQTNGHGIKESKREVVLTCGFKKGILYSTRRGCPHHGSLHQKMKKNTTSVRSYPNSAGDGKTPYEEGLVFFHLKLLQGNSRDARGHQLEDTLQGSISLDLQCLRPEASLVLIYRPNVEVMKGRVDLAQPVKITPDLWCGSTIHYHSILFGEK